MSNRLTNPDYKILGFHSYIGKLNPYDVALTLGEIPIVDECRMILDEVFSRLAAYEDADEQNIRFNAIRERAKKLGVLGIEVEDNVNMLECFEKTLDVIEENKEVLDRNAGEGQG